ncbi:MAG: hypothetical protein M3R24_18400 [Chloroflexota bacterium]|nr:hypothetical protein [Chloroflexota bacterium]PLS78641.1 MAG: hypothetical protein CYG59_17430 [Chloroflexota bacterium]
MLITVDLAHPDNDVEVVGLAEGETLEVRLGPRGYAAYRLFGAAARMLFLSLQDMRKADIAAATEMMIERESSFIRQRLDELRPAGGGAQRGSNPPNRGQGGGGGRPGGGPPERRNGRDRGRR